MLKNSWLFPLIEWVHLCGLAVLAGTIMLLNLRLLGLGLRRQPVAQLAGHLAPWTRLGFAIMLTTGPVMFFSDTARYLANGAFRFKMACLALALGAHFTLHRRAVRSGTGRLAAIVSLVLWTCVVLGGRAIADFDI